MDKLKRVLGAMGRFLAGLFTFRRLGKLWAAEHIIILVILVLVFTPVLAIFRDVSLVIYAHSQEQKAITQALISKCKMGDAEACRAFDDGDRRVPFTGDYSRGTPLRETDTWGTLTNSLWLADKSRLILPYFTYEGIGFPQETWPMLVAFVPFTGERSLHVAGTVPAHLVVYLNERLVLDPRWNDEVDLTMTLVHELVHNQGGKYIEWPPETWEAYTSAATIEVLAGLCNYGDKVACAAFWMSMEDMIRGSLKYGALEVGAPWAYEFLANTFLRSDEEIMWARKQARFYDDRNTELKILLYKYDYKPWHDLVLPQFWGQSFRTGHVTDNGYEISENWLFFDDMLDLLGPRANLVRWLSKH